MSPYDYGRLQGALDLLKAIPAPAQLSALRNLCMNNGVWTVPDYPDADRPCLFEVTAFAVSAHAATPEELPRHWMKAAQNILANEPAVA